MGMETVQRRLPFGSTNRTGTDTAVRSSGTNTGPSEVTPSDLPFYRFFRPNFMRKHTEFESLEQLFTRSPVELADLIDRFTRDPVFNRYIAGTTEYRNWGDLFVHAVSDYLSENMKP